MTRKELYYMLNDGSILKESANYEDNYLEYCCLIEGLLYAVDDDEQINISSLDTFKVKGSFDMFVRKHDIGNSEGIQKICEVLSNILAELKTWKKNFTSCNPEKINNTLSVLMIQNKLCEKRERRRKKGLVAFLIIFIILSISIFVLALIATIVTFPEDSNTKIIFEKILVVCGVLDFANGVIAFVWERLNDLKKKKEENLVKRSLNENDPKIIVKVENSKIINGGCCNRIS